MATFEGMGLCEPREYHEAFESRLTHDQLTRDELYVARFRIEGLKVGYRVLGRVGVISAINSQSAKLEFQIVDDDMQPLDIPPGGEMKDGAWNSEHGVVYQPPPGRKYYLMHDACFAHYDDGIGFDLEVMRMLDRERDLTPL